MSSNGSNSDQGNVPRAGINKFATVFARRGKGAAGSGANAPAEHRVIHEKESSLPNTLVAGLVPSPEPLQAAHGDDDLMGQPPKKNAPRGKPPRITPGAG